MVRRGREPTYDDETLENMKRYYGINNHDDLLKYIKKNRLIGSIEEEELHDYRNK
jgi:hypothetical protein